MFCVSCGKPVDETDTFCRHCGQSKGIGISAAPSVATRPRSPKASPASYIAFGGILLTILVLSVLGIHKSSHQPEQSKPAAAPVASVAPEQSHISEMRMTPQEAKAAQQAMLDTAEVYRKTGIFTEQTNAFAQGTGSLTDICASVSQVEGSARHALSSLGRVPVSPATRPMIHALQSGLSDVRSGANSIRTACDAGEPVRGEPLAKMIRGMRTINAFTTAK